MFAMESFFFFVKLISCSEMWGSRGLFSFWIVSLFSSTSGCFCSYSFCDRSSSIFICISYAHGSDVVESGRREGKKLMIQKRRFAELVVGIGACTGGKGLDREENR